MDKPDSAIKKPNANRLLSLKLTQDILEKFWKRSTQKNGNFPIGVTSFVDLVTKYRDFYVEKGTFVKQVIDMVNTGMKMILITRPSGWGKSINLSMLKHFLNREVDKCGNPLNPQPYRNLFQGGCFNIKDGRSQKQVCLQPLKISDSKNFTHLSFVRAYQGSCPIIFLSFSSINCANLIELKKGMLDLISYTYQSHSYLRNTSKSVPYHNYRREIARLSQLPSQLFMKQPIDSLLKGLSTILDQFHKCENLCSFILIDDSDLPVQKILKSTGQLSEARKAAQLIANILRPIISQSKTLKIVATGKINIFEAILKGYKAFGLSQLKFYDQFGFNTMQVETNLIGPIFKKSPLDTKRITQYFLRKIVANYGGYVCSSIAPTKIEPYSTLRYLQVCTTSSQLLKCQFINLNLQQNWFLEQFISISGLSKIFTYLNLELSEQANQQTQPQFLLQLYISANNQFLLPAQINNIIYNLGIITGIQQPIGRWAIKQSRPPNNSISEIIGRTVVGIFKEVFQFDDLSLIELTSTYDICSKFQHMLKYFYRKQPGINNVFIAGAFYYRYRYCLAKKNFMTAYQLIEQGKANMIDNIYVPCDNRDQIIILHFHYCDAYEPVQKILHQIIYPSIQSNYFERALQAGSELGDQIQQYVFRLILVMPDTKMRQLEVSVVKQYILTPKQMENIVKNIQNQKIKEQWHKLRRLGTLKKGKQSLNILNIFSNQIIKQSSILLDLLELQPNRKQRKPDQRESKGQLSRIVKEKKLPKQNQ